MCDAQNAATASLAYVMTALLQVIDDFMCQGGGKRGQSVHAVCVTMLLPMARRGNSIQALA